MQNVESETATIMPGLSIEYHSQGILSYLWGTVATLTEVVDVLETGITKTVFLSLVTKAVRKG